MTTFQKLSWNFFKLFSHTQYQVKMIHSSARYVLKFDQLALVPIQLDWFLSWVFLALTLRINRKLVNDEQ